MPVSQYPKTTAGKDGSLVSAFYNDDGTTNSSGASNNTGWIYTAYQSAGDLAFSTPLRLTDQAGAVVSVIGQPFDVTHRASGQAEWIITALEVGQSAPSHFAVYDDFHSGAALRL